MLFKFRALAWGLCLSLGGYWGVGVPLVRADAGKIAILFDKGGKDDKSFNAAAYRGALDAEKELKVKVKAIESSDDNSFEPLLRSLSEKKYDLIFAIGVAQAEALKKVAAQFPDQKYAIVDAEVKLPNVRSLLFNEHEGSFLMGAIAAWSSKSGKIGFMGGMDIPLIRRFELAYIAGARYANPKIEMKSNFIGVTGEAWHNPPKAKEIALSQFGLGVDVIFAAAGASNSGLFDAAEEKQKWAIGCDSNQNWIKPGKILTSMLKRVDVAVLETTRDFVSGKFQSGTGVYGLTNKGIDYALDHYNDKIMTPEIQKKANDLKAQMIAGKVFVPDYYNKKKK